MKRYSPQRADDRAIEDKAFSLIMAMDDAAAKALHEKLSRMVARFDTSRAKMFLGQP